MAGKPAAKMGDKVQGIDIHKVTDVVSGSTSDVPVPFTGSLTLQTSTDVLISGQPAAIVGKTIAVGQPPHVPPPGFVFTVPPLNTGTITKRPGTVLVNGAPLACIGDTVDSCNVNGPAPTSTIVPAPKPPDVFAGA
jgi:uncharacterized Zn-binding protein involved in type VI secretion